ncbi:MAG TPA: P1 family peptidase [Candidatus Limnocylindrales bacterium]|nr:P1 family peptidase [Candidatus Limnocylindrales bacterium]
MRARDLGIAIGRGTPGPNNAITDVAGVRVGHTTLVAGDGPLRVGEGPIRTGVTVIVPGPDPSARYFAGSHVLNGNGEMTGLEWIREAGQQSGPLALTNTHSVGVVRDALVAAAIGVEGITEDWWFLPVVGEVFDGTLNDIDGFHIRPEHVHAALAAASGGPVAEGNVGAGTGAISFEFKGGIGTSSRMVDERDGGFTVGSLVQTNFGFREWLRIDGVPVGEAVNTEVVPSAYGREDSPGDRYGRGRLPPAGSGSIIVVLGTDAPLLPHQCERVAQRAGLGLARVGSIGGHTSGDLFLCFATGNRVTAHGNAGPAMPVRMLDDHFIDPLFMAAVEATEEAVVNALVAAETMTGRDGHTAHALPHDLLVDAMARYGRGPRATA